MQMPAKFREIPSMGLQDIKETKVLRTNGRTDGQRENSIPTLKLRFGGGGIMIISKTKPLKLIHKK